MPFDLKNFQDPDLDADYVAYLVDQQGPENEAFHNRLWNYYRNPLIPAVGVSAGALNENSRPYFLAQEVGLPARITGVQRLGGGSEHLTDLRRKEVVIENDIGWRIQTMVDFLFGRPATIRSLAEDRDLAAAIEQVLSAMLDANGGAVFLQEIALFGAVFGFVDIALRIPADWPARRLSALSHPAGSPVPLGSADRSLSGTGRPGTPSTEPQKTSTTSSSRADGQKDSPGDRSRTNTERATHSALSRAVLLARLLRLETVEAPRILPILAEDDYRKTRYWIQRYHKHPSRTAPQKRSWLRLPGTHQPGPTPDIVEVVEILSPNWWQRYEDRRLIAEGSNALGRIPIVHVQNIASPGTYPGLSDVEPMIPLQDELNTRLSDRAHRVTYQSFKMYLGKGIDDFLERPVGPGQMWATQNLQASIEEFGSDDGSPSEDIHIDQIRQAMDKVSGVTPLAAGLIRGEVGNLTSAAALRVVLSGLLAKTTRKRLTFGVGLQNIADLVLDWLDRSGVLKTQAIDRRIEVHWPSPLPSDEAEQLRNAQVKQQLGVPTDRILAELGYDHQIIHLQSQQSRKDRT
ncbi:MAG TPA: phage portal protein [Phycisphaerae bacterium]|nr:phage portal protein [Phycisphaerae bacterium]